MFAELATSLRSLVIFSLALGMVYPAVVTVLGQALFPEAAAGSLIYQGKTLIGSELLAQKFTSARYFHARPSGSDFAANPSGASNLSPTSAALNEAIAKRRADEGADAPADLLLASASGLDPHISLAAALHQVERIAKARAGDEQQRQAIEALVHRFTEPPQFGFLGQTRVNVLNLNRELDKQNQ